MAETKWEKQKKQDCLDFLPVDEAISLIIGFFVFVFAVFEPYQMYFIISVILWYWLKIRYYERKIIEKEKDIYNVYYENCGHAPMEIINGKTEHDRKPMFYDLKQLENKRRFLVDKFVVLNLILIVLFELFIKK